MLPKQILGCLKDVEDSTDNYHNKPLIQNNKDTDSSETNTSKRGQIKAKLSAWLETPSGREKIFFFLIWVNRPFKARY